MLEQLLPKEVVDKLIAAIRTGRYFIVISRQDHTTDENDLSHYWYQQGYPKDDVPDALDFIKKDYIEKEKPKQVN